jgi:hypothetical protein
MTASGTLANIFFQLFIQIHITLATVSGYGENELLCQNELMGRGSQMVLGTASQ